MAPKIYPRILKPPTQSFFLLGPRGSGKSMWLRRHFPRARVFNLLDEGLYQSLLRDIGLFANILRTLPRGSWVVVDEVQRIPELLNEVHRFMEEGGLRFVLCGSSARKLKRTGTNLLAGRALKRNMYPFLPEELGKDFRLEEALAFGTLPVIWQSASKPDSLSAYVELYLKEEIQAEALVRNLPGFARFLPIAALFHGQVLNIASLSRDAQVSRTTAQGYLEILEDTLMAFRLPAFEGRLRVREKRHPKWYWVDAGIVRSLKKQFGAVSQEERGVLFEGWVAGLLRSYQDCHRLFDHWYYWSPAVAQKTEVDFLLELHGHYLAIEVKSSSRIYGDDLKGLKAIQEFKKDIKRLAIYTGSERMNTEEGIEILPAMEFVRRLENKTLWK